MAVTEKQAFLAGKCVPGQACMLWGQGFLMVGRGL